jgi:hypothetical protein
MASPFSIFRKYGKSLMAVLVVMLMVGWGVLGILQNMQESRSPHSQDPIVVSSTHGELTENKLLQLRQQKNLVRTFLARVMTMKAQPQFAFFVERQINQLIGGFSDEALVDDWFLSKEADSRGIVIPDVAVDKFLDGVTGGQVRAEEYRQVLLTLQQESPLRPSKSTLYNSMRTILASNQMRMMTAGMLLTTPAERFDGYQRLRRRATVELIPVKAEDYKAKVREPNEAELRELYNKHKDTEPVPGSATPGFKVPHRSSFLYVKANYEKFVKPEAITEKEIQEHYEKFKDERYQFSGLGPDPEPKKPEVKPAETPKPTPPATPEKPATPAKPETPPVKPADEKKPADAPKLTPPASPEKPATPAKPETPPAKPADEKKPADAPKLTPPASPEKAATPAKPETPPAKPADEKKPADAPKLTPPASPEKPATPAKQETPPSKPADEKKSSAIKSTDDLDSLVAFAEDAAKAADDVAKKAGDAAKTDAAPVLTDPAKASTTPATPVTPSSTQPAAPAAPEVKKPEAPPQLTEKFKLPENIADGPSPKHDPLWKVEESIRTQLAREKAAKLVDDLINKVDNTLTNYSQQLFTWDAEVKATKDDAKKQAIAAPKEPDLEAVCKQVSEAAGFPGGLTAAKTGFVSAFEASRLPGIGESTSADNRPFAYQATRFGMRPFTSLSTTDTAGNRYRFMKTAAKETFVPTFEEAKSEVLNVWKTIEARKLIKARAEELAAEAIKQKKSLKELYGNDKSLTVLEPESFAWLSRNSADPFGQRTPPQLTEVEGVVDGGDEFMRGVFSLEGDGSVGVTMNNPLTIAYVVHIKSYSPSPQLLRDTYLVDPPMESMTAMANDQRQIFQTWMADRRKVAKLTWKRDPGSDEEM